MAKFDVMIPEELRGWVDSRMSDGRFADVSDYFIDLIRRDHDDNEEEAMMRLRAAIDVGRASGISDRSLEDIWKARLASRDAA